MNKKIITVSATAAMLLIPLVSLAFNAGPIPNAAPGLNINTLVDVIFNILWPVFVAIAIIMFIIAAIMFLTAQGDPAKVKLARDFVIWGVVGVAVALIAFSIPFVIRNTINQGI